MRCRICGSTNNLKYTLAEIRGSRNKRKRLPLPLKEIANAINGNICKFCDLRLQNFHHEENDSTELQENVNDVPIFVDDDERLYNIFYKRQNESIANGTGGSLGSDGDPEVIEVLTSRETTPDITTSEAYINRSVNARLPLTKNTRIVDVINLEDDDDDDNNTDDKKFIKKVIKPKSELQIVQQGETRLLGCLSLVTSDSDSEINFEPCKTEAKKDINTKAINSSIIEKKETADKNIANTKDGSVTIQHTFPVCEVCGIRFLDIESMELHLREYHRKLACPACDNHFSTDIDLVYHIRNKHRLYDGDTLCESNRYSQDSAMTIRLRFEKKITFYECQLCGLIDLHYKLHKDHIMQNHADESKSLRDPMMKAKLKCPACQQKIATHRLDICRHLLLKHTETSERYLNEITDLSTLGVSGKTLEKVQYSGRVLTLMDNEERFFACQLCPKVCGTVQTFSKHLNGHNIDEWKQYKERKSCASTAPACQQKRLKRKTEEHSFQNIKKNQKDQLKPNADKIQANKKTELIKVNNKSSENQDRLFKKPLQQTNSVSETKRPKKLKRRNKNELLTNKKGLIKIKRKAPLKHFPAQKYNCKHCQSTFKGFRKWNLHIILSHRAEEYQSCNSCKCAFTNKSALVKHCQNWHKDSSTSKRKRKNTKDLNAESERVDENFNKGNSTKRKLPQVNTNIMQSQKESLADSTWLKELYHLSHKKKKGENKLNTATAQDELLDNYSYALNTNELSKSTNILCRYCSRLFSSPKDLSTHEIHHVESRDLLSIQFSPNI